MWTSRTTTPTAHASRYLQQLSKHWAHKCEVEFTAETSHIELPIGQVRLKALDAALDIEIEADSPAAIARLQDVVADHLDRFAHRESGLSYDWHQPASTTGS